MRFREAKSRATTEIRVVGSSRASIPAELSPPLLIGRVRSKQGGVDIAEKAFGPSSIASCGRQIGGASIESRAMRGQTAHNEFPQRSP